MNKIILVGRLTRDPEVRYNPNGKAIARFTIAVDRPVSGDKREADFIPVIAWDKLGEVCGNNLTKGRLVLAEGRLQIRNYETTDGQKRQAVEVVAQNIEFLDKKPQASQQGSQFNANSFGSDVFPDEEIPF